MDFTYETRETALRRLIEDLGFTFGDPRIQIKPYNMYAFDLRYSIAFTFDTLAEKDEVLYKRAFKMQKDEGFSVISNSDHEKFSFSIYFAPTPKNRFDIVIFDEKTRDIISLISEKDKNLALIKFFEFYGFKVNVGEDSITTSRGRSRITTKTWEAMFSKRQYDLFETEEERAKNRNTSALFNYNTWTSVTSLSDSSIRQCD